MTRNFARLVFPSAEDYRAISQEIDFETTSSRIMALAQSKPEDVGPWGFMYTIQAGDIVIELQNKWVDVARSYILLRFYYDIGIPDDEWVLSPGRNGESAEYFPHFEEQNHYTKEWFDYYADAFYFKLFSALDILGHWLNSRYRLGIKQRSVNFNVAVKKLKGKSEVLATN